jgi:hypothetical protein
MHGATHCCQELSAVQKPSLAKDDGKTCACPLLASTPVAFTFADLSMESFTEINHIYGFNTFSSFFESFQYIFDIEGSQKDF